jgi:polyisoprenoid-binding protein YceI
VAIVHCLLAANRTKPHRPLHQVEVHLDHGNRPNSAHQHRRQACQNNKTMAKWIFEPGHSAAEFSARHMMVTWVRGHFKNIQGTVEFDPDNPAGGSVEATLDAGGLWTGEPDRDTHLKSADFLDVEHHPRITFRSRSVDQTACHEFRVIGDLTTRGVTREVTLDVQFLGTWQTPYWSGGVDRGPITRAGFTARTQINRHDFGVSWNSVLDRGGLVVGNEVQIIIDVEALREPVSSAG